MINQLLNQPYINTASIPKKTWYDNGFMSPNDCPIQNIKLILLERLSYNPVFLYENRKIDSDKKFIDCLNKISFETLEDKFLCSTFWKKFGKKIRCHQEYDLFKNMSFLEKCKFLKISEDYLADRNLESLLKISIQN